MNIVYLSNIRMPSERANAAQTVHVCNSFAELGHSVHLIVSSRKTGIEKQAEDYFGFQFKFKLTKVWTPNFVAWGPLFFMSTNIMLALNAIRIFRREPYDVVYCRDEWICLLLLIFLPKRKLVYESHEAKYNLAAKKVLGAGIKCVCISEGIYNNYIKKGVPKGQCIVAHDGVGDSFFSGYVLKEDSRKVLGLSNQTIAMYIGGFDQWKGVTTFFEASNVLEDVRFVAIGGTKSQIIEFSQQYPKVNFLGQRPYRELAQHQQAADILVIPNTLRSTLSSEFTSPLKLFAHMTSKVPLVISDIPSLRVILNDTTANLFTPDSPESLADTIQYVCNNYSECERKADLAFIVSKEYSWKSRARHIIKFITN